MSYFVITRNEDGDICVQEWERDALELALNGDEWGDVDWFDKIPDQDPNYWPGSTAMVIIRGDIVTPDPITTVKEWLLG